MRARAGGAGAIAATADYDAWDNPRGLSGAQGAFGWTGEQRDAATGFTYLRARYYSPGVGRFLTRDALSPNAPGSQGYNPYAYAGNNPTTFTDPSGHLINILAVAFAGAGGLSFAAGASGTGVLLQTAVTWFPWVALAVVLTIITVILVKRAYEKWCAEHGATDCIGEAWSWVKGGFDGGKSWVSTGFGAVAGGAAGVWEAVRRPRPLPWTGPILLPPPPVIIPFPGNPEPPTSGGDQGDENDPKWDNYPRPWPFPPPDTDPGDGENKKKCPPQSGLHIYHRLGGPNHPTQSNETARLQVLSGEIWGKIGPYDRYPVVRAYRGPLPPGKTGIEFATDVPVDRGGPPGVRAIVTWNPSRVPPSPYLWFRDGGDTAVLGCVRITKNTQI